ncbi:helix-turn-helix domain-containing protein [Tenggerimyces flavus]|uniref:Helix-turn-helix domain-containing protein n=1 Tax=Tenggerimyces flavus TaxID=1708749 RepID=A0ABV7YNG7_9ACTN|nr:helix-turn-helix transcriptional regulator [Tenggerimyces flavus]MBM7784763.1 transcriptional regulator with XRE-family HTH domain [Tenggerimyces flavus]
MNDHARGATIAKLRLARRLGELRVDRGYTANQVCDRLGWGRGKVGRFEANVWVRPELSDIRDLLRFYKATEEEQTELVDLASLARNRAWWRELSDVFDNEFAGYEADAARIGSYVSLVIPGLLQTPSYMESLMRRGVKTSAWRSRAIRSRLRRQEILERTDGTAPEFAAVLTEGSLLYHWGTPAERRAQVEHLVEFARMPHIDIRVLRFADGPHAGMSTGGINLFEFASPDPSIVFLEDDLSMRLVPDQKEVLIQIESFRRIQEAATDPVGTIAFLKKLAETLE